MAGWAAHYAALGIEQQVRGAIRWWARKTNIEDVVEVGGPREDLICETLSKVFYRNIWNAKVLEIEKGVEFVRRLTEDMAKAQMGAMKTALEEEQTQPGPPPDPEEHITVPSDEEQVEETEEE